VSGLFMVAFITACGPTTDGFRGDRSKGDGFPSGTPAAAANANSSANSSANANATADSASATSTPAVPSSLQATVVSGRSSLKQSEINSQQPSQLVKIEDISGTNRLGILTLSVAELNLAYVRDWMGDNDLKVRVGLLDINSGESRGLLRASLGSFPAAAESVKYGAQDMKRSRIVVWLADIENAVSQIRQQAIAKGHIFDSQDLVIVVNLVEADWFEVSDESLVSSFVNLNELITQSTMTFSGRHVDGSAPGPKRDVSISGRVSFRAVEQKELPEIFRQNQEPHEAPIMTPYPASLH
jgi:hypothetical protein